MWQSVRQNIVVVSLLVLVCACLYFFSSVSRSQPCLASQLPLVSHRPMPVCICMHNRWEEKAFTHSHLFPFDSHMPHATDACRPQQSRSGIQGFSLALSTPPWYLAGATGLGDFTGWQGENEREELCVMEGGIRRLRGLEEQQDS